MERVASIFRIEEEAKQETSMKQAASFTTCSSERSVEFQRTTWSYIPDGTTHYSLFIYVKFRVRILAGLYRDFPKKLPENSMPFPLLGIHELQTISPFDTA
jgi:hypothetical protein